MARITPNQGTVANLEQLRDYEPYAVSLVETGFQDGAIEYGGEQRLTVDWQLPDGSTLRDYIGLKLGKQKSGEVAKLRKLLNALAGRPEQEEIAWFDDESLEWSYDGQFPVARLTPGLPVIIRGKHGVKEDGTPKFGITAYQPAASSQAAAPPQYQQPQPVPPVPPPPVVVPTPPPIPPVVPTTFPTPDPNRQPVLSHPKQKPEDDEVPF